MMEDNPTDLSVSSLGESRERDQSGRNEGALNDSTVSALSDITFDSHPTSPLSTSSPVNTRSKRKRTTVGPNDIDDLLNDSTSSIVSKSRKKRRETVSTIHINDLVNNLDYSESSIENNKKNSAINSLDTLDMEHFVDDLGDIDNVHTHIHSKNDKRRVTLDSVGFFDFINELEDTNNENSEVHDKKNAQSSTSTMAVPSNILDASNISENASICTAALICDTDKILKNIDETKKEIQKKNDEIVQEQKIKTGPVSESVPEPIPEPIPEQDQDQDQDNTVGSMAPIAQLLVSTEGNNNSNIDETEVNTVELPNNLMELINQNEVNIDNTNNKANNNVNKNSNNENIDNIQIIPTNNNKLMINTEEILGYKGSDHNDFDGETQTVDLPNNLMDLLKQNNVESSSDDNSVGRNHLISEFRSPHPLRFSTAASISPLGSPNHLPILPKKADGSLYRADDKEQGKSRWDDDGDTNTSLNSLIPGIIDESKSSFINPPRAIPSNNFDSPQKTNNNTTMYDNNQPTIVDGNLSRKVSQNSSLGIINEAQLSPVPTFESFRSANREKLVRKGIDEVVEEDDEKEDTQSFYDIKKKYLLENDDLLSLNSQFQSQSLPPKPVNETLKTTQQDLMARLKSLNAGSRTNTLAQCSTPSISTSKVSHIPQSRMSTRKLLQKKTSINTIPLGNNTKVVEEADEIGRIQAAFEDDPGTVIIQPKENEEINSEIPQKVSTEETLVKFNEEVVDNEAEALALAAAAAVTVAATESDNQPNNNYDLILTFCTKYYKLVEKITNLLKNYKENIYKLASSLIYNFFVSYFYSFNENFFLFQYNLLNNFKALWKRNNKSKELNQNYIEFINAIKQCEQLVLLNSFSLPDNWQIEILSGSIKKVNDLISSIKSDDISSVTKDIQLDDNDNQDEKENEDIDIIVENNEQKLISKDLKKLLHLKQIKYKELQKISNEINHIDLKLNMLNSFTYIKLNEFNSNKVNFCINFYSYLHNDLSFTISDSFKQLSLLSSNPVSLSKEYSNIVSSSSCNSSSISTTSIIFAFLYNQLLLNKNQLLLKKITSFSNLIQYLNEINSVLSYVHIILNKFNTIFSNYSIKYNQNDKKISINDTDYTLTQFFYTFC